MSRFFQQRLAELLGLVSGKSQARASSNMTVLVLLVILYRASFWFARGAGKKLANQKECRVAERDDGIPVIIVAAVKKSERKGASDRSIQTLRSDTYFVSYCTDGLIARRRTGVHTT